MGFKLEWDTTTTRAAIIGLLLFFQALTLPILTFILTNDCFPNMVQIVGYVLAASLILMTYMLTFLKYQPTEE